MLVGIFQEYINEKYEQIVQYAELDGFIGGEGEKLFLWDDLPIGFCYCNNADTPEILILDEVLSVGDMFFRKKSEAGIRQMMHSGSTVLIVSHSMDTIRKNCNRVIWIEKGKLMQIGKPDEVCSAYAAAEKVKGNNIKQCNIQNVSESLCIIYKVVYGKVVT